MDKIKQLQEVIDNSNNIVFFGGAGVSTESGLKDFRSVDGLYSQKYDYPPEEILSHDFFFYHTKEFYKFYKDKLLVDNVKPNPCHLQLAKLEQAGKLKAIITQNIDNLHSLAGSKVVLELHGTIMKNHCVRCNSYYEGFDFIKNVDIPICPKCQGIIKPDVVLYNEQLDQQTIYDTIKYISKADTLIVGGCSLTVYPAAGFINYFHGKNLVVINKSNTYIDKRATLVINEPIGKVMSQIKI